MSLSVSTAAPSWHHKLDYSDRPAATPYSSSEVVKQQLAATTATQSAVNKPVEPETNTAGLQKHSRLQKESVQLI